MKINKFLLVGIFLLAIISLGAVSAAEDAGNATAIDNGDILMESSVNDDVISEDSEGVISDDGELEDSGARISTMTTAFVKGDDDASFTFEIPQYDVDGNIYVYLDSKDNKVFEKEAESWDNEIYYNNFIDDSLSFGTHTIFVEYKDSSYYLPVQENFTFDYNYYSLTVYEDAYLSPNHDNYIRAYFPYDVAGRFILKVDGKVIVDSDEDGMDSNYAIELDQFACGNHTWNAEYSNGNYEPFKKSGTFTLGYDIEMWCDNEWEVEYCDDFIIHIGGPSTLESVVLEYDGKSKTVPLEYGEAEVNINDCGLGEHTITVKVLKSDMFYAGEETATLNVIAKCGFDYSGNRIRYNSDDSLYFRLPSDAKGTLLITVDEKDNITADLKNGVAKIPLADYSLGSHSIEVRYDDGKYSVSKEMDFNVVPNVKYEYYMLNGTDNVISIELPDDATGTFRVSSDDYYVLDKTVDIVNGHASITLPPFMSTFDEDIYLYWECDGDDYFYDDIAIRPMFDPASTQINITGSNKFIKGESGNYITISHALNANGRINVSIDGKQMDTIDFGGDNSFEIYVSEYFEDLALGSHKIRVDYYGDKYFEDSSKEITVELIPLSINIPANFVLGLDSVYILLSNDADGYAIVYVNGSEYAKRNVDFHENGRYINVPLEDLKLNEVYDIKVVYTNDSNIDEVTKSATIKTDYDFEIEGTGTLYYGDENIIRAYFFSPMQGDVTLKIADKTYTKALDGSEVLFNLSDVDLGEYEITVTFDGKGISSKSHSDTVYVEPHIDFNSGNIIDESTVSLNLPADATGSLQIYVYDEDDNLVKNVSQHMKNGDALITFNLKKLGEYRYQAEYDGDDYIVEESTGSFTLRPKISVNSSVYIGEKNPLTFEMPSDAKGTLTVKYGNMEIPCEFINGKASVMLPAWDIEDELLLSIRYSDDVYGNFGFGWDDEIYVYINKLDSALNLTVPENISAGETVSIVASLPDDATGSVIIEIGEKSFEGVIENGKAVIKVIFPEEGNTKLIYSYDGDDRYCSSYSSIYVDVIPKPIMTAKDTAVLYSAGSYYKVRVADGFGNNVCAGESVKFYINNKLVTTVKTDKNGYASLKVTQIPNTYTVKAVYKGASITKKLTVKHLVTLKKVTVKKSAKKLVLTATLGKVNGKYLKNKKVTFKFNGKTYKAKTTKKGVAKVTIKSSVLKKLKVGKKLTYQATYLKDTVKKTVKVKK